jgi:hypothetical protein
MIGLAGFAAFMGMRQGDLVSKWFPQPSGNNCMEEYTRAAAQITTDEFVQLSSWQPADGVPPDVLSIRIRAGGSALSTDLVQRPDSAEHRFDGATFATVCALERDKYAKALQLVHSGNLKPLERFPSAEATASYVLGMAPSLESLANLGIRSSYADFLEGKVERALDTFSDIAIFADRISRLSVSAGVVGNHIMAADIEALVPRLGQLTPKNCTSFQQTLDSLLQQTPPIRDEYQEAVARWPERIASYVNRSVTLKPEGANNPPAEGELDDFALATEVQQLSPEARQNLITNAQQIAKSSMIQFLGRLQGDESNWVVHDPNNVVITKGGVSALDDLGSQIAHRTRPGSVETLIRFAAVARMKIRILDAYVATSLFRWQHGRLPKTLGELDASITADRLAGGKLKYLALPGGGFEIFSGGIPETGPIRLNQQPVQQPAQRVDP